MVSGQRLPYNVYGGDREGSCERINKRFAKLCFALRFILGWGCIL